MECLTLTITEEKSKKASVGAPRPVIPSKLGFQIHQKSKSSPVIPSKKGFQIHQKSKSKSSYPVQDGISNKSEDEIFISRSVNLSLGMLIKDVGQVTTVPGEGFGRRLNASGVVPLTSL